MEDLELLESFVSESTDLIDDVEPLFIQLEKTADSDEPVDIDTVNKIFRLFHSMKGSAAFLNLNNVAKLTHHAETLLDAFRNNPDLRMTPYFLEVQLQAIDAIRIMLDTVTASASDEGLEDLRDQVVTKLIAALEKTKGGEAQPEGAATEAAAEEPVTEGAISQKELEELKAMIKEEGEAGFAPEAAELIEKTEQCLMQLEKTTEEKQKNDLIQEAFRHLHNFKGSCGLLQLTDLAKLSHAAENILAAIKDKKIALDETTVEVLLQAVDSLSEGVNSLSNEENPGAIPSCDLMIEFLNDISGAKPLKDISELMPEAAAPAAPAPAAPAPAVQEIAKEAVEAVKATEKAIEELVEETQAETPEIETKSQEELASTEGLKSPVVAEVKKIKGRPSAESKKGAAVKKEFSQTIRVDLKRLDKLINLVGELVIAESMVFRQLSAWLDNDNDLERKIHHLQRVSSELQDVAMSVRMVPLSATFKKMFRLIHDLSRKSGKKVDMKIVGEETEVDKNVIEQINDPLVHIIRNSVDHGIESAEGRLAAGKPANGVVTLEAKHEGGEVWISIIDDGRGLDRNKILAKGIERNLVSGDGSDMSDDEVFQLIFEPGFSTADKVTDISGRGVGMDVVKKNIEKLNGRIKVKSTVGVGTTISLRIPLTLAIIDGMLVKIGTSLFTIPLLSIKESLRANEGMLVTLPDDSECITVRNEQIPVLRLYKCFRQKTEVTKIDQGVLVIVEADGEKAALLVDEIVGQQEIVIKGLSDYLGAPKGISGCTVLGNGEVSLIIDISSLLSRGH